MTDLSLGFTATDGLHFVMGAATGLIYRWSKDLSVVLAGAYVAYQVVEYLVRGDTVIKDLLIFAAGFALVLFLT